MYGGIIDSVSGYTHSCTATNDCANANVDDYATITINYHTTAVPQKVQLLFGGHLAVGSAGGPRTWGLGYGASNISGGPYHIKWDAADGASIGNRDNQIMGSAIIFQNTGITTQIKNTNGTTDTGNDTNVTDGSHVDIGTGVYDTATLSGSTATAGGTVSYYYEKQTGTTADCSTGTLIGSAVTVTNGVIPASGTVTFSSSGTYEFWAVYSGDTNNNTSTSTCGAETVVVNADTATTTQIENTNGTLLTGDDTNIADGGHVNIGTGVYDTASLSGNTSDAGGTVSYYYEKQSGATADCTSGTLIGTAVTVTSGSVPVSATITFSSSGTYEFWAVYSGDTNNNGSTSTCGAETVVVNADTATTTQIKNTNGTLLTGDDTNIADGGQVAIGTGVYDTASLSGNTSGAGGTVTFYYQKQTGATADCSSGTAIGSAVTVTSGAVPASDTVSLTAAGTYEFWAVYSGDTNNNGSTSTCGAETVIVNKNSPVAHSTPVVQIKDTFTVTGFTSDATGSVTVGLYTSSTCTTGQVGSDATFTVAQAVAGAETTFVGVLANTYYFKIYYAGDANNSSMSSCAESVGVTITSVP